MTTLDTRSEAHESVNKSVRYRQIIDCLRESGTPLTAKEIAVWMMWYGFTPTAERNFTAPRLTEMAQKGIVEPVGKKKCSYTGRIVTLYDLTDRR